MKLSIRIVKDEKGHYRAMCTSLPGCVIDADSRRDAYAKMQDAVRGYIASVSNCAPRGEVRLVEH
jgi:predicted RNase H-like HicB family nuclease